MAQSTALCMKDEYIATTGLMPRAASPAAKIEACSSAIPPSKNCDGIAFFKWLSPVPALMAAVMPTTVLSFCAIFKRVFPMASW